MADAIDLLQRRGVRHAFQELRLELSKVTSSECMAPRARLELATLGLEIPCSIQLSYRGNLLLQLVFLFFRAAVPATPGWLTPTTTTVGPMFGFTERHQ